MRTGRWQQALVSGLHAYGVAAELKGSALRPETLDGWSDADVDVRLPHDRPAEALLGPLWAYESALDGPTQVLRTVLIDGRRADLTVSGGRLLVPVLDAAVNEGTSIHRSGRARDAEVDVVGLVSAAGDLLALHRIAAAFDRWHGELDLTYVADWEPLRRLIERGSG